MWDQGQAGIKRMPLAAMSLVTGLRPRCLPDAGRLRAGGGAPGPSLEGGWRSCRCAD